MLVLLPLVPLALLLLLPAAPEVLPATFRKEPPELDKCAAAVRRPAPNASRLLSTTGLLLDGDTQTVLLGEVVTGGDDGTALGEVTTCDRSCGAPATKHNRRPRLQRVGTEEPVRVFSVL